MPVDRKLFAELRKLDRHDLRRVLIFVRGLLHALGDDFGGENPSAVAGDDTGVTYRLERVKCGKAGCTSCPHGPYWYAYFREGKRLRSRYIGRELPDDVKAALGDRSGSDYDPRERGRTTQRDYSRKGPKPTE